MKKYRRKPNLVTAIQLNFDTRDKECLFTYNKWGDVQTCKPNDWVVNNENEVYTIDNDSFKQTYQLVTSGRYTKVAHVWAREALYSGKISTKEGFTHFNVGDMIVSNDPDFIDQYAMTKEKFFELYEESH